MILDFKFWFNVVMAILCFIGLILISILLLDDIVAKRNKKKK